MSAASTRTHAPPRSPQADRVRRAVLGAWGGLLLVVWGWNLSQGFTPAATAWALFYSLPLLAPLPGLWRGKRYTHAWATLCVLPYLVIGITESVANSAVRVWAAAMLAAGLLLFIALIAYLRVTRSSPALPAQTAP